MLSYWDRISCTQVAPEAVVKMTEILESPMGNAQSPYRLGSQAMRMIEESRDKVAHLTGAESREITFTASGTEANNLAITGIALGLSRKKILLSAIEHVSVMNTATALKKMGFEVEIIPVDSMGHVQQDVYLSMLDETVGLVSIQTANPEIGTIQRLEPLISAAKERGAIFHTDAVAAVGWIPVNVKESGVDSLTFSGAQFHGPPGAAAMYLRKGVKWRPVLHGGSQEHRRRPGLENVPAIVGFGIACELAEADMAERSGSAYILAEKLRTGLSSIPELDFTGDPEHRIPGHVSVIVRYVEGEALLLLLDMHGISAASGSSCTAKDLKISPVLMALGLDHTHAQGSVVFSSDRNTTLRNVEAITGAMPEIVNKLRSMSPLWAQSGTVENSSKE